MADKNFFKDNFALVVGLALPAILMIGFMIAASVPKAMGSPPKYDVIFWTNDYQYNKNLPVTVNLVVKDGTLKAQYNKIPNPQYPNNSWVKLYRYNAKEQTVEELTFGYPDEMDKIEGMREDTVEATKNLKLNTKQPSPDGFDFTYENYRHGGIVNEVLFGFGGRNSNELRLRNGANSVTIKAPGNTSFSYGVANFIGWVTE